jgi:hypothetical protein
MEAMGGAVFIPEMHAISKPATAEVDLVKSDVYRRNTSLISYIVYIISNSRKNGLHQHSLLLIFVDLVVDLEHTLLVFCYMHFVIATT